MSKSENEEYENESEYESDTESEMSESEISDSENEEYDISICEITSIDNNNNVYQFSTKSGLNTRVQLIKKQYNDYLKGKKSRKAIKNEMLEFIKNNGGINKMKFRRLETYRIKSNKEIENKLNKHYLQSLINCKKKVCNILKPILRTERFKKYYEQHKEEHLKKVKDSYIKNKEKILEYKKKIYGMKKETRELFHCDCCNVDVYNLIIHNQSKRHLKNSNPDYIDPEDSDLDESE